jgi:hypothetical protein
MTDEDEIDTMAPVDPSLPPAPTESTAGPVSDERIRASLTRRAEAVQVTPDLEGLAKRAGPRRTNVQRFPLVAVAVVIAALAITTAVLRPASDRDSHLISRSGSQRDLDEDPTSTTNRSTSTSRPDRPSTTTTTAVPTTVQPPEGTTPSTLPGGAPDDGTGVTPEPEPGPADPCAPVDGVILASASSDGDVLHVVEYGRNATLRHLTIWRDPAGADACPQRLQESSGQPFGFSLPTPSGIPWESHTIRCSPPRFEFVTGYSDDGTTWRFGFETYAVEGDTVSLVEQRDAEYVEPADHDAIESLLLTDCGTAEGGG